MTAFKVLMETTMPTWTPRSGPSVALDSCERGCHSFGITLATVWLLSSRCSAFQSPALELGTLFFGWQIKFSGLPDDYILEFALQPSQAMLFRCDGQG